MAHDSPDPASAPLRDPAALLPLTPAAFHIMLTLVDGERHGYGIMQEVALYTDGTVHLGPTTLYRSIKQMLAAGLIEELAERPDPALDDERRRYYRLTAFGQRVAAAETQRLEQLLTVARAKHLQAGVASVHGRGLMPTSSSSSPPTRPAPRIVSATVSAYALVLVLCPRDLRAAYGAQMAQVFRQCCRAAYARGGAWGVARLWLPTLADLLAGAAAEYRALLAQWWMGGSPAHRTRASTITVFRAYSAFVIAGCSFAKIPEHDGVAEATRAHPVIGLAFALTAAGSLVALLAVVAGGLPLAVAALRSARAERRRDIPLLFAVPPLALAAFVGVTVLLERLTHDPSRVAILLFAGAFVLAVLASAAAVSAAIARGQVGGRLLSYARASAALVALAMSAMLASTVIWGLTLRAAAPRLFDGMDAYGVFTWTRVVALMALATLAALVGVGRGFAPRRGTRMRV